MTARADKDPLAIHLETYEEAWKTDHEEVKHALWTFEDKLAVGLGLFEAIHSRYWTWRERVFRGEQEYTPQEEQAFKERFEWWLRPCEPVLGRLEGLEQQYGSVEGASEFRRKYREAVQILETWQPMGPAADEAGKPADAGPIRVLAHSIRPLTLEQGVAELSRATHPAPESVPLKHKPDYSKVF